MSLQNKTSILNQALSYIYNSVLELSAYLVQFN